MITSNDSRNDKVSDSRNQSDSDKTSGYYVKKDEEEVRRLRDEVKLIKEYYVYTN